MLNYWSFTGFTLYRVETSRETVKIIFRHHFAAYYNIFLFSFFELSFPDSFFKFLFLNNLFSNIFRCIPMRSEAEIFISKFLESIHDELSFRTSLLLISNCDSIT